MDAAFPEHMNRLVQILPAQFDPAQLCVLRSGHAGLELVLHVRIERCGVYAHGCGVTHAEESESGCDGFVAGQASGGCGRGVGGRGIKVLPAFTHVAHRVWCVYSAAATTPRVDARYEHECTTREPSRRERRTRGTRDNGADRGVVWCFSDQHLTHIHVGHSPVEEHTEGLENLASCLTSVMPRLVKIQSNKESTEVAEPRWRMVQRLLFESDRA